MSEKLYLIKSSTIKYKTFLFNKHNYDNKVKMIADMSKSLSTFLKDNLLFFQNFDNIIVYYDNGQNEISQLLNIVLNCELNHVEFRKVLPIEYRLFQVADLVCTIELLAHKRVNNELSSSEKAFIYKSHELKKT